MANKKGSTRVISWVMTLAMIIALLSCANRVKAEESDEVVDVPLGTLVAHWTFDENYNESIGGLTTNLGAKKLTYTDGIYGKAAVFNGKDNYLVVDPEEVLNLGNSKDTENANMTISAWINLGDSSEKTKYLLDKGIDCGWEKNDDFYWSNPYRICFEGCEPEVTLSNSFQDYNVEPAFITEGSSTTSGKYVEGGEWFLLTVTYDGKRIKIYRDNELLNQLNYTDGITFNNDELYIGVDHSLSYFFEGYVDDLRIYTAALTYDQVDELYQNGLTANKEFLEPTKQLVAYYAFDDNLKDSALFKNDAEKIAVGGTTKYIVGKNGKAITMSKGNYILVPAGDQLNFDTEFTVSFWLKLDKDGEYPVLYRQNPSDANDDENLATYQVYVSSWGDAENTRLGLYTNVYDPDYWIMSGGQTLSSDFFYSEDKVKGTSWFHYTYTYQDGQMKSYLNGILRDKTEASDLINIYNAAGDLLIGYDGSTFINGAIDELKIYNKCLSATDVEKEAKRVDSISLNSEDVKVIESIDKGKSVTITSILLKDVDTDKNVEIKLSNKNFTLKSSSTKIFKVTEDGKITGVKAGKAKLTITYGAHTKTYNIVIK